MPLPETIRILQRLSEPIGFEEGNRLRIQLGTAFRGESRALDAAQARQHRPVLEAILEVADVAWCSPQCCNAAAARQDLFTTKTLATRCWAEHDPDVALSWSTALLARLFADRSNQLAQAACALLRASPQSTIHHLDWLAARASTHPRWTIQWALVRTVQAALHHSALSPEHRRRIAVAAEPLTRHPQRQLQKDALRIVTLVTEGA